MGGKSSTITNTAPRIAGLQLQTSAYGRVIPIIYGTQRVAANIFWYDDFVATAHTVTQTSGGGKGGGGVTSSNTTYTYTASLMFGLCEGQINTVGNVWADKELKSLDSLGLSFFNGSYSQNVWGFLTSNHPDKAINYRGQAYVANALFNLGDSASLPNLSYEVKGLKLFDSTDANPKEVVYDFLTNANYGAGFPASKIGDLTQYNNYCLANNLLMSPMFDEQKPANEHIEDFLKATNSAFIWSEGVLKIVPYGDSVATANGVTFTPNTTPAYDLTDDDFIDIDEPIKVTRSTNADAYNHIKIEFLNRANAYNAEIAESKDLANIDLYGLRPNDSIQLHSVCDSATAKKISQIMLQRTLYVRNKYDFKVSWKYCLLEPMDLITLTDSKLGFDKLVVRVTEIQEDEEGVLSITAEEWPFGVASATLYPNEQAQGTAIDYNVPAGNINPAVIFEPPLLLANNYELWFGFSGGKNWGGCDLYVSYDNESYAYLTTVSQPTRTGYVSANWVSGSVVSIDLTESRGTLTSTTGGALALIGGEIVRYTTATLTAQYKYNLTVAERGLYNSTQTTHAVGSRFERLDSSITKQPFTIDMIGKTIYYKALSFNIYGAAKQAMEDVTPFTFTIQGDLYPPANVIDFAYELNQNGVNLKWAANSEIDVKFYEIREINSGWGDNNYIWKGFATRTITIQTVSSKTYYIKAIDSLNNYSNSATPLTVTIPNPTTPSNLTYAFSLDSSSMAIITGQWTASTSIFEIDYYLIEYGTTSVKVKTTVHQTAANWIGSQNFSVTAYDKMGFHSATATLSVTKLIPNAPTNFRAQVIDNNVLFYWTAPDATSLPVTSYELRKGATWETATLIGNKAGGFTTVFESSGGQYTYWIASIDADNRYSLPTNTSANVAQPPDFVLKADNTSTFSGTKNNSFIDVDGSLLTLVDTAKTWTTHFTSNGWSSPQDQIDAGYPYFLQPATSTGYYEESYDVGTLLASSRVTVNMAGETVAGTVTTTCDISISADGITWTTYNNYWQVYATSFRYYKFRITATSEGHGIYKITSLNSVLDLKLKNDAGTVYANASDAGGTVVNFNVPFVDIQSITVSSQGTTPAIVIYDFLDEPYPTSFKVYLYNMAGARISGNVGWSVKGN